MSLSSYEQIHNVCPANDSLAISVCFEASASKSVVCRLLHQGNFQFSNDFLMGRMHILVYDSPTPALKSILHVVLMPCLDRLDLLTVRPWQYRRDYNVSDDIP